MERFIHEDQRREYLVSHALVRHALSQYAPVSPSAWRFEHGAHGRPEVRPRGGATGLRFNLSHTQGKSVVAVALEHDVGVDVEAAEPPSDLMELAEQVFSKSEVQSLESIAVVERPARFFAIWTVKEAYIKAIGLGLAMPLDAFTAHVHEDPPELSFAPHVDDEPAAWQVERVHLGDRWPAALAIRRGAGAVDLAVVTREASELRTFTRLEP